jgi:thiol-disulfide isomerase/thioredoxin
VPARRTGALVRSHASRTAAAIACAIAAAFFSSACGPKAPSVVAVDFDGLQQLLASGGARATVVNCWATWCAPCVAELPDLLAAAAPWKESVQVVLLSYDLMVPNSGLDRVSGVAHVQRFLDERKLLLGDHVRVVLYDDAASKLDDRFDLPGPIPTTFVLDRDGKVVGREKSAAARARFDELFSAAAK